MTCNGANDGSIDLAVGGGASCLSYTFNWSNGATTEDLSNIGAGTYTVTVTDANGCSSTSSITLTAPNSLSNTLIPQVYQGGWNISCNGIDGALRECQRRHNCLQLRLEQRCDDATGHRLGCRQLHGDGYRPKRLLPGEFDHADRTAIDDRCDQRCGSQLRIQRELLRGE
ncbi:MAG: hypothetical protein IPN95_21400 [Bacteroidetes bacterium]|nr:hypothetical protein [Bacteroidota bacterium]